MSNEGSDDPEAVEDGCGLLPYVPRELVSFVYVRRVMLSQEGARSFWTVPRRFTPDDDEITLAEVAGGSFYTAQARDSHGRFLKGYPAREFWIDGAPKDIMTGQVEGEVEPPAPPPPAAPPAPVHYAAQGLPVASPLPGMPSVSLDISTLPPEMRAWVQAFAASQSFAFQSMQIGTQVAIESARRGADVERSSAQSAVAMAQSYMEKVVAPRVLKEQDAIASLARELGELRGSLATERAEHGVTRDRWQASAVRVAYLEALFQSGGRMPEQNSPGWGGFVERLVLGLAEKIGAPGAALVAANFGLSPDQFRQLTDIARGPQSGAHANGLPHGGNPPG